jgi:tetratricopeptide (TPR) repeat protein
LLAAALLLVGAAAAVAGGWYGWRWYAAPRPPAVALAGADPAVAAAVASAEQKVRQDPYSAAAWADLGKRLRAAGYLPEAAACFGQAAGLEPAEPRWPYLQGEALLTRDPDAAMPPLRRAADLCDRGGVDAVAPRLRLAEALLDRGLDDEAAAALRRALEVNPDDPSVHLDLGLLAYARDDLEDSRDHLRRCVHSPATRRQACARLAEVCRRLGEAGAAADYARQADAAPPDRHWPDPWLADCLQQGAGADDVLGRAGQLEAAGRYAEAAELLRGLSERAPDYRASVGLGKNLAQLGDLDGAEKALRDAIRLDPDGVQARSMLGKLLWTRAERRRGGDAAGARPLYEDAAAQAREAVARKPDDGPAYLTLGLALQALGSRAEAITAFRKAVACLPDEADPYLRLGESLAEDGQKEEARKQLEQAVRLAKPDDARPREALARLAPATDRN